MICNTPLCDTEEGIVITPTGSNIPKEIVGESTDDKPTNVPKYSVYLELDTGTFYYFDGSDWQEIPCGCGGVTPTGNTAVVGTAIVGTSLVG